MTKTSLDEVALSRPARAADAGPVDDRLYDLVETRLRRLCRDNPVLATSIGIHTEDARLGNGDRDAVLQEIAADRAHLAEVEAIDPEGLSAGARFERDLEIHNVRRTLFEADDVRIWERRSTAMDTVGTGLFLLFARDFSPLAERLDSITGRVEQIPGFLDESRRRAVVPQVRLWQQLEIDTATELPVLFADIESAAARVIPDAGLRRLERALTQARESVAGYTDWLTSSLAGGVDDWALGRERFDEAIALRSFDGLDADAILEIGWQQLADAKAARVAAAREIDPDTDEATVVDRVKADHPATFEEALEAYRTAMVRARQHLIDRAIVTVPPDERISVVETPDYLRNIIPFAAYFEPPKFDRDPTGIYVVTPSVGGAAGAMLEHNYSSISNTSIHEAYPGHHLQLSVGARHPSLSRLTTEAPEFVEGWGMYSEQMMREQGFDVDAKFRLTMYTDVIWRACRIVLDVQMHRGEIGVDEAVRWLVKQTSFEEPNARAEIHRYTFTPTYQLSYLLGKVLLLQLRADEQRRLGSAFSLRGFHDTLLRNGTLPISFHRRLLAGASQAGSQQSGGS